MRNNMSDIWDKLMKDEKYQKLINQLPEDERELVLKSLKEIVLHFENGLITPLKNLQNK